MTTIELKNCPDWKVEHLTDETVQTTYGYPFLHSYNFRCKDPTRPGEAECIFHFRSVEELHPLQLERIINLYTQGENAGRRAEKQTFQEGVGKVLDASGLRPLLNAVLRDLMEGPRF